LTVNGTLQARGGTLAITTTNAFTTAGSGTIDGKEGGSVTINASGDCTLNGSTITVDAINNGTAGGTISITCPSVIGGSTLSANGAGNSSVGGDGGTITVNASADKVVLGSLAASSAGADGFGGWVTINAVTQLTVGSTITAEGTAGGFGGLVELTAGGPAVLDGAVTLTATAGGGYPGLGGEIDVEADSIVAGDAVDVSGSTSYGGWAGTIDWYSDTGAITLLSASSLSASGGGTYAVGGLIILDSGDNVDVTACTATGSYFGGEVDIEGQGTLNMSGTVDVTSNYANSEGGDIWIYAVGDLNTAAGTTLKAYGAGSGSFDGSITLEGCNVNLGASLNSVSGSHTGGYGNLVTSHGQLIAVSAVSMNTDSTGPNQLICPCSSGGCSVCEHQPVFLGTSSPAYTISPQSIPSCD